MTLTLATVGLGLNLRAWILLGPHLHERFDVGLRDYVLLMALPLLVAALARLPVGVLTDRYGARVMFPVVSLAGAAAVFGLGLAESLPAVVAFGSAAGLAGAALVVGGSLVSRTVPYGRRGLALGVFSLGTVVAVVISAASRGLGSDGRRAALVLGVSLVVFAGLAALVFRDPVAAHRVRSPLRTCVEMTRLASATSLSVLYALALGGVVAIAVYLPVYLATAFHMEWFHALAVTGAMVGLGATARLLGGWWTDRQPTPQLLMVCYTVAAGLCLVAAMNPQRLTVLVIGAIAVCDGVASGALLALIGKAARADSVGAVMGATGAAAALGALVPAALIAGAERVSQSHATAWILLAAMLLIGALYVRAHGLRIGMGLAVRFEPEPGPTAMTVAVVGEAETHLGAAAVVARLAELAASDELVVVYGSDEPARLWPSANVLVVGLRDRLPRHSVVGVGVAPHAGTLGSLAAPLGESVEAGEVAIAVTPTAELSGVAAELSSYLRADRVLRVSYTPAGGAGLHEVWNRDPAATTHW
ncbi:nitrate/nitrite transporter [Plantactinospora solaniradicis]|uniref:Nitrate/nitrite transporter n=1 Tax=Plantactinospora solaniradicis TaxID=1723736 RepID=A0ABW1KLZ7_9ACTN